MSDMEKIIEGLQNENNMLKNTLQDVTAEKIAFDQMVLNAYNDVKECRKSNVILVARLQEANAAIEKLNALLKLNKPPQKEPENESPSPQESSAPHGEGSPSPRKGKASHGKGKA